MNPIKESELKNLLKSDKINQPITQNTVDHFETLAMRHDANSCNTKNPNIAKEESQKFRFYEEAMRISKILLNAPNTTGKDYTIEDVAKIIQQTDYVIEQMMKDTNQEDVEFWVTSTRDNGNRIESKGFDDFQKAYNFYRCSDSGKIEILVGNDKEFPLIDDENSEINHYALTIQDNGKTRRFTYLTLSKVMKHYNELPETASAEILLYAPNQSENVIQICKKGETPIIKDNNKFNEYKEKAKNTEYKATDTPNVER